MRVVFLKILSSKNEDWNMNRTILNLWISRAKLLSLVQPHEKIAIKVSSTIKKRVPCVGIERSSVVMPVTVVDVRGVGNCLYHAVWLAAKFSGIQAPFGMQESDHVFDLRVLVANKLYELLRDGLIINDSQIDDQSVCDLVAKPNQYEQHSGCLFRES